MTSRDDEIEKMHSKEQSRGTPAQRDAAERRRQRGVLQRKLKEAKQKKDARAFTEILKSGNVKDASPEWKRAWEWFYYG